MPNRSALTGPWKSHGPFLFYVDLMDLVQFLVLTLATWRIAYAIYDDSQAGPFLILHRIRYRIGIRYDETGKKGIVASPAWKRELADMHQCMYCMSPWYGLAATLIWIIVPKDYKDIIFYFALPFAISAGIVFAHKFGKK